MLSPAIDTRTAILKYKEMCGGKDFYGFGPDIFLNTQAANTIIEIDLGDSKRIFIFDTKTPGYPPRGFIGSFHIIGGNWINPKHKTPFDVLKSELNEEIENSDLVKTFIEHISPFGDYMSAIPKKVHGSEKHPADIYIHCSSIFVTTVPKHKIENILKIPLTGSINFIIKRLQNVLKPIFMETEPGVISYSDIKKRKCKKFSWGHDKIFSDYLLKRFNIQIDVPGFDGIIVDKLLSSPSTPYSDRLETKHNRQNPLRRGMIPDDLSFKPEKNFNLVKFVDI